MEKDEAEKELIIGLEVGVVGGEGVMILSIIKGGKLTGKKLDMA